METTRIGLVLILKITPTYRGPEISAMKKSYQWPDYSVIPYEGITKIQFN